MVSEYMSLKAAAIKWHSKLWYIKKACEEGQIPGTARLDGEWIIPQDMERPPIRLQREEAKPKPVQHGSDYKDHIYKMTMDSFPSFDVMTKKIGNTIYSVYSSFSPKARETITEKIVRMSLRDFGHDVPADVEKAAQEMREEARSNIPTDEQLREYYLAKFTEIGFSEDEIIVLMEKIDEHIQTRQEALKGRR